MKRTGLRPWPIKGPSLSPGMVFSRHLASLKSHCGLSPLKSAATTGGSTCNRTLRPYQSPVVPGASLLLAEGKGDSCPSRHPTRQIHAMMKYPDRWNARSSIPSRGIASPYNIARRVPSRWLRFPAALLHPTPSTQSLWSCARGLSIQARRFPLSICNTRPGDRPSECFIPDIRVSSVGITTPSRVCDWRA